MSDLLRRVAQTIRQGLVKPPQRVLAAVHLICGESGWGGERAEFLREYTRQTKNNPAGFEDGVSDSELAGMLVNFRFTAKDPVEPPKPVTVHQPLNRASNLHNWKDYHSFAVDTQQEYYRRAGLFAESWFTQMSKGQAQLKHIWRLHADGLPGTLIAEALELDASNVQRAIARLRAVMETYDFALLDLLEVSGDACQQLDEIQGLTRAKRIKLSKQLETERLGALFDPDVAFTVETQDGEDPYRYHYHPSQSGRKPALGRTPLEIGGGNEDDEG